VTIPLPAIDQHQIACIALERTTPLLVAAVRAAPATARPAKMLWTNVEIAAHLLASVIEADKAVRGEASVYDAAGPSAALDEQMVAQVPERDPAALADRIADRTAAFLATARTRPGNHTLAPPRSSVATFVALIALDHHLHGGQMCDTTGSVWPGEVSDMHAPLSTVLPYAFDPGAARGLRGSFTLRLRGVDPVRYAVANGELQMDPAGRSDCTITADPQAFLRFGIGVTSQLRAVLTGTMRAGGRKPWLAFAVTRLFPPIAHGGVAR
jgi:putative sterol carrier protein